MNIIIYITLFVVTYGIDISSALLHRKLRPNNFREVEANDKFRKCLDNFGVAKGIKNYIILSTTELILLFACVIIASKIIFSATLVNGISFTLLLLILFHIGGTITNLLALLRKDRVPSNLNLVKGGLKNNGRN